MYTSYKDIISWTSLIGFNYLCMIAFLLGVEYPELEKLQDCKWLLDCKGCWTVESCLTSRMWPGKRV